MKIDLYEYVKEIITNSNLNLEENGMPGILVDNDQKVVVKRVDSNSVSIEFSDKHDGNFKRVELDKLKSLNWEAMNINLLSRKATRTNNVIVEISNDYTIKVVNSGKKLFILSIKDNNLLIHNYKGKIEKIISMKDFNMDEIIEKISEVVHNAYNLVSWKKDADVLFNTIKPVIVLGITSIVEKIENNIDESKDSLSTRIDDIDKKINMLKSLRKAYIAKLNDLELSSDAIERNKTI